MTDCTGAQCWVRRGCVWRPRWSSTPSDTYWSKLLSTPSVWTRVAILHSLIIVLRHLPRYPDFLSQSDEDCSTIDSDNSLNGQSSCSTRYSEQLVLRFDTNPPHKSTNKLALRSRTSGTSMRMSRCFLVSCEPLPSAQHAGAIKHRHQGSHSITTHPCG